MVNEKTVEEPRKRNKEQRWKEIYETPPTYNAQHSDATHHCLRSASYHLMIWEGNFMEPNTNIWIFARCLQLPADVNTDLFTSMNSRVFQKNANQSGCLNKTKVSEDGDAAAAKGNNLKSVCISSAWKPERSRLTTVNDQLFLSYLSSDERLVPV